MTDFNKATAFRLNGHEVPKEKLDKWKKETSIAEDDHATMGKS